MVHPTVVLAHPLTESAELGLAPAFVAVLAGIAVVAVARLAASVARPAAPVGPGLAATGLAAEAVPAQRAPRAVWLEATGRVVGVVGLLLAIFAGRLGVDSQFTNIAPALVIGFGWPALLALSAVVGPVWGWLQPFDTLARGLQRLGGWYGDDVAPDASAERHGWLSWMAVVGALGWTWWLAVYLPGLDPRPLSLALGLYTIATLTGCLIWGRPNWLSSAEIFGVMFGAIARARRLGPVALSTPHLVAFAVLLGGLSFAEMRFSRWYLLEIERLGLLPFSAPAAVIGFVAVVGLAAAAVGVTARWASRTGGLAGLHRVLPWLVVGVGLAGAMERDRLWTSAQLVVIRASDPFGTGLDLLGTASWGLAGWPLGDLGRVISQIALLTVATAAGVVLAMRAEPGRSTRPGVLLAVGWLVLTVASVATL